jgi:hypothetical protein
MALRTLLKPYDSRRALLCSERSPCLRDGQTLSHVSPAMARGGGLHPQNGAHASCEPAITGPHRCQSPGSLPSERADVLDDGPAVGLGQVRGTAQAYSGRPSSADSGGTTARGHSASPGTTLLGSRGHRDHRRLHEAPRRLSRGFSAAFAPCTIRGGAGKGPVGADDPASTGLAEVFRKQTFETRELAARD